MEERNNKTQREQLIGSRTNNNIEKKQWITYVLWIVFIFILVISGIQFLKQRKNTESTSAQKNIGVEQMLGGAESGGPPPESGGIPPEGGPEGMPPQ